MLGVGVDITHIPRITRLIQRWESRFLQRAFAPSEIARYRSLADAVSGPCPMAYVASRWAAKEALHKAVYPRTGIRLDFAEIEVCRWVPTAENGGFSRKFCAPAEVMRTGSAPAFAFHGAAAQCVSRLNLQPSLSISHDGEYAVAFVVVPEVERAAPIGCVASAGSPSIVLH